VILPPGLARLLNETRRHEIALGTTDYDGDGHRFQLKDLRQSFARDEQYIDFEAYEISGALAELIGRFAEPSLDDHVLALDPAEFLHRGPEPIGSNRLGKLLRVRSRASAQNSHSNDLL